MEKSVYESARERKAYVAQVRASFQRQDAAERKKPAGFGVHDSKEEAAETVQTPSTLGLRTIIAVLLFAAFVYCDKQKITWEKYDIQDVFSQIEWEAVPVEELLK